MKNKFDLLTIIVLTLFLLSWSLTEMKAQSVSINTTGALPNTNAMLDISSTTKGILIPRMLETERKAIAADATTQGLLVYQTDGVAPGYYYWDGSAWVRLFSGSESQDWKLTGNAGTVAGTNFIGTTDAVDFTQRTNNVERVRITSTGQVLVNLSAANFAGDLFEVQGNATFPHAINGYTDQPNGNSVYGENYAATGAGTGAGVYGISLQTGLAGTVGDGSDFTRGVLGMTNNGTYAGVEGYNFLAAGDGIYGFNAAVTGAGAGAGVYGISLQTGSAGVVGSGSTATRGVLGLANNTSYAGVHAQNSNSGGDALFATNSAANGVGIGSAIYAISNQIGGATIIAGLRSSSYYANAVVSAISDVTTGNTTGVIGDVVSPDGNALYGFNTTADGTGTGSGVYGFTSQSSGFGIEGGNGHTNGTGVFGVGNDITGTFLTGGSGGAFTGSTYGIAAYKNGNLANNTGAGYFMASSTANVGVAVAYRTAGTNYKIIDIGAFGGTVSTDVYGLNDFQDRRIMFAPESPEILLQDFGKGKLTNGSAHIDLDPIFAKNIIVNDEHQLQIYVTLEGDCKGVYVTNKTNTGFDVVELQGGSSNVSFTYFVSGNRKNYVHPETRELISKSEGVRFPLAPNAEKSSQIVVDKKISSKESNNRSVVEPFLLDKTNKILPQQSTK